MVPDGVKSSAVCKRGGESTDGEMNEMTGRIKGDVPEATTFLRAMRFSIEELDIV